MSKKPNTQDREDMRAVMLAILFLIIGNLLTMLG